MSRLIYINIKKVLNNQKRLLAFFLMALFCVGIFVLRSSQEEYDNQTFINENKEHIDGYEKYLDGVENQAEMMKTFSVFQKDSEYGSKNIDKTVADFRKLHGLDLSNRVSKSIEEYSFYDTGSIFLITFTLLLVVYILKSDSALEEQPLIKSTIYGNSKDWYAKLISIIIMAALGLVIIKSVLFIFSWIKFGSCSLSIPIQSIKSFSTCVYKVSIGGFILVSLLITICSIIFIILISSLIVNFSKSIGRAGFFIGLFFVAEYLLYTQIRNDSPIMFLKHINIFSVLNSGELLGKYQNVNIGGEPVARMPIVMGVFVAISGLCFILNILLVKSDRINKRTANNSILLDKFSRFDNKIWGCSGLLRQEVRRIFFSNFLIIIVAGVIVFGVFYTQKYDYTLYSKQEGEYLVLNRIFEGEWDKDKQELYEKFIEEQKYPDGLSSLSDDIESYVKEMAAYYDNIGLVHSKLQMDYFNTNIIERNFNIILLVFLLPIATFIIASGHKNGMNRLVTSTKNGNVKLTLLRVGIMLGITILFYLVIFGSYYICMLKKYGDGYLSLSVHSLVKYKEAEFDMSIRGFLIYTNIMKFLQTIGIGLIGMKLGDYLKNYFVTIAVSIGIIVIDTVIKNILNEKLSLLENNIYTIAIFVIVIGLYSLNVWRSKYVIIRKRKEII